MSAGSDAATGEQDRIAAFTEFRQRMNQRILAEPNQVVRRFFALDTQTYQAGALDEKTKELCGLVASMVLRCDDCISYTVPSARRPGSAATRCSRRYRSAWWWGGPSSSRTCAGRWTSSTSWSRARPRQRRTITTDCGPRPGRRSPLA